MRHARRVSSRSLCVLLSPAGAAAREPPSVLVRSRALGANRNGANAPPTPQAGGALCRSPPGQHRPRRPVDGRAIARPLMGSRPTFAPSRASLRQLSLIKHAPRPRNSQKPPRLERCIPLDGQRAGAALPRSHSRQRMRKLASHPPRVAQAARVADWRACVTLWSRRWSAGGIDAALSPRSDQARRLAGVARRLNPSRCRPRRVRSSVAQRAG